jgi:hypothetical protein
MKSESIPPALRNLLTKLEYISMIERGQKPCFSDMTFVQSNSWLGAWKRLITGENKKNLLFEIEQIIDRTILAIEEYSNKEYIKLLLDNLSKAKTGIENLILTYTEHPETISNLRVYIINIDLCLKKYGYVTTNDTKHSYVKDDMYSFQHTGIYKNNNETSHDHICDDIQKIIGTLSDHKSPNNIPSGYTKTSPLPIVSIDNKTKSKPESFKRFTPKEYIEKHMFTPSSPDQVLSRNMDSSDVESKSESQKSSI